VFQIQRSKNPILSILIGKQIEDKSYDSIYVTLEQYLENFLLFEKCQENEEAINNQRRGPLFRQCTTIITIHTDISCENMNRTDTNSKRQLCC